ncbi:hypothetical protein RFI_25847 [Reticulomyxa filosa]|uniref:Uncharacterized protein n=1 Tax=Reticulomyxa filosa TaxID=46433 RepID=X6MDN0_RETFI|nr:hypothetical protein RFI_25847 [Reticulomyxa filosa]|eukprot:ETO11527.1 hypothetical protein RFI_25847 [Reticulomyxa filosa]
MLLHAIFFFCKMNCLEKNKNREWGVAKLGLKFIFGPVLVFYKIAVFVVMISKYNGAFAVFIWETIATLLLYQAHVNKEARFLEPSMAFMWLAFVVNVFEIWYCSPANGRVDSVSVLGTNTIKKLELESDKRIPKQKVNILLKGFAVSLVLLFLSGCLVSSVSNDVLEDITIYNFDKSWKQNYNKNKRMFYFYYYFYFVFAATNNNIEMLVSNKLIDYIMCENKDNTNSTRRLIEDLDLTDLAKSGSTIKSKYENDYDALCTKRTYGSMAVAVALASIDWFLLLLLAIYWHVNDKSQENFDYDDSQAIWYSITSLRIDSVSSSLTWIGRIIEMIGYDCTYVHMNSKDAEEVENLCIFFWCFVVVTEIDFETGTTLIKQKHFFQEFNFKRLQSLYSFNKILVRINSSLFKKNFYLKLLISMCPSKSRKAILFLLQVKHRK